MSDSQVSELIIEDIVVGSGDKEVTPGTVIRAHYTGYLPGSEVPFDTSKEPRNEKFVATIGVGQVIAGWDKGILGMKNGGTRKLTIPAHLAYGDMELPGIPANSTLVFLVEELEILE